MSKSLPWFQSAQQRMQILLSALLIVMLLVLVAVIYSWRSSLERAILENMYNSRLSEVADAVARFGIDDGESIRRYMRDEMVDLNLNKMIIFSEDGDVIARVDQEKSRYDERIEQVISREVHALDDNSGVNRSIYFYDQSHALVLGRLFANSGIKSKKYLFVIEFNTYYLLGDSSSIWASLFALCVAVMLMAYALISYAIKMWLSKPLELFAQRMDAYSEGILTPALQDGTVFIELSEAEKSVLKLLNHLSVKTVALQESTQFIHKKLDEIDLVIRCASVGTWTMDLHSGHVVFSEQWSEMMGMNSVGFDATIDVWKSQIHPEDWIQVEQAFEAHLKDESPRYRSEHRIRHADGYWLWVLVVGEIYERDSHGKALKLAGIQLDITHSKLMAEEAKRNKSQLEGVFRQPHTGIAVFDFNSQKLLLCNDRFAELYRGTVNGLTGLEYGYFVVEPSSAEMPMRSNTVSDFKSLQSVGKSWESLFICRDGQPIWLHVTLSIEASLDASDRHHEAGYVIMMVHSIEERKRLETVREIDLRRNEQTRKRFDTMLSSMQEGVLMFLPDRTILEFNDIAPRLLGLSVDEMWEFRGFNERWEPKSRWLEPLSIDELPISRSTNTAESVSNAVIHVTSPFSKFPIWLKINVEPVFDSVGKVDYLVVTFSDVTITIELENKMRESAERLSAVMDNAPDGMLTFDDQKRVIYSNKVAETMFDYSKVEFFGVELNSLIESSVNLRHDRMADHFIASSQSGDSQPMARNRRVRAVRRNGEVFDVEISLSFVRFHSSVVITAMIRDITERRALESRVMRLSDALEQSPITSIIFDKAGVITYVNQAGLALSGYTNEQLLGSNVFDLYSPLSDKHQLKTLVDSLINARSWVGELSFVLANGDVRANRCTMAPLRDSHVDEQQYIVMQEDIEEKQRSERELDDYRNGLEKMVVARTLELNAAKQRAEAAAMAKASFLANMSHEIRTPMNAITGFAQLLRQDNLTQKQSNYLQKIIFATDHLLHIINDILDISKIEAGKVQLNIDEFTLHGFATEMLDMVRQKAEIKNLKLVLSLDEKLPEIIALDRMRLGQMLLNLLSNAVKFTEEGEVELRLESCGDNYLRVSVRDTGIGLTEEQQARLFQAFEQADASTTRRYGGTGLGLAICKQLTELMNGHIFLTSQPGVGSTFIVELPLLQSENGSNARDGSTRSVRRMEKDKGRFQNARVLVVEDDLLNQELIKILLDECGIRPAVLSNGKEALEYAKENELDLIFMDIQMPVMDGLVCTRAIRSTTRNRHTPIIALTANVFDEERKHYLESGMNEVLAKPMDIAILRRVLAAYLDSSALPANTVPPFPSSRPPVSQPAEPHAEDLLTAMRASGKFDLDRVLNALGGRDALLSTLVRTWLDTHVDTPDKIEQFLRESNIEEAARLAHSMKGAAAAIGATNVSEKSARIELVLRQKTDAQTLGSLIQDVRGACNQVVDVVAPYVDASVSAKKRAICIVAAAEEADAGSYDLMYDSRRLLACHYEEQQINQILDLLQRYRFNEAVERLHAMIAGKVH